MQLFIEGVEFISTSLTTKQRLIIPDKVSSIFSGFAFVHPIE
jgi:hypothetical protein